MPECFFSQEMEWWISSSLWNICVNRSQLLERIKRCREISFVSCHRSFISSHCLHTVTVWWWQFELVIPWRQCPSRAFHSSGSCAELFLHTQALVVSSYAGEFQREMFSRIQVQGRRRGHTSVGATGANPLGTGEAGSPRAAGTGMSCQPSREGGLCPQLLSQAPFFRKEQLSGAALQEVLSEQASLNSGFLLQIQVDDTQSPEHLSWCLRAESGQCSVHWVVLVSPLPFKRLCTLKNSGLCEFQGVFLGRIPPLIDIGVVLDWVIEWWNYLGWKGW